MEAPCVVLDMGAGSLKVGLATDAGPRREANAVARPPKERRTLVGNQVCERGAPVAGMTTTRPFERGYAVRWDVQAEVLDRAFDAHLSTKGRPFDAREHVLLATEPPLNFADLSAQQDEVFFEHYGFRACRRCPSAQLVLRYGNDHLAPTAAAGAGAAAAAAAALSQPALDAALACGAGIVVDSGFSYTHALPVFQHRVVAPAVRRLDAGGKVLTNYLKELVSYRSVNVSEMFHVMDRCKEQVCRVCVDGVAKALHECAGRNGGQHRIEYLLPDGVDRLEGCIKHAATGDGTSAADGAAAPPSAEELARRRREEEATIELRTEPFMVPEVLFRPMDIGLNQHGVAALVAQSAAALPEEMREVCLSNILVCGGNSAIPGFRDRLAKDLAPLVETGMACRVRLAPPDPITSAWHGGAALARDAASFYPTLVTKRQYEEEGADRIRARFERAAWIS